jgi:hypothetical protein
MSFSLKTNRVRKLVIVYFVCVAVASMWPIYPVFSRIEPWVLGVPFSLAYLVLVLVLSFLVLLSLYLWESGKETD